MAGGLAPSVAEPTVIVPVAPVAQVTRPSVDWSGFYVGLQAGYLDADVKGVGPSTYSLSDGIYGAHIGYMHDFGRFVFGGELRYDDVSDVSANASGRMIGGDEMIAASLRFGYDMGRVLPYLSIGGGRFTAADNDKSNGVLYGIGADYALTDNWRIGIEATHFKFDRFDAPNHEFSGDAVGLSVSYVF